MLMHEMEIHRRHQVFEMEREANLSRVLKSTKGRRNNSAGMNTISSVIQLFASKRRKPIICESPLPTSSYEAVVGAQS